MVNPGATPNCAECWRSVFARAFISLPECYLSKLIGGSRGKSSQPPQLAKVAAKTSGKPASKSKFIIIKGRDLNLLLSDPLSFICHNLTLFLIGFLEPQIVDVEIHAPS